MKNFQALIEAVARLDAPADLTIIGDGPYREELQRIAREDGSRYGERKRHVAHRPSP